MYNMVRLRSSSLGKEIKLQQPWTRCLLLDNGNFAHPLVDFAHEVCVCIQSDSVFALEGPLTSSAHCILSLLTTSPPSSAALCVFNVMTLFLREGLTRSGRSDSFTSRGGRTTGCHITPRACWGLLGESSPRLWPTLGPWWFTAGWCALELTCFILFFLCTLTSHCILLYALFCMSSTCFIQSLNLKQFSVLWSVDLCTSVDHSQYFGDKP